MPDNGGVGITPIADTCVAAAQQPGTYTLTCREGGTQIEGHAQIMVTGSDLVSIEIQPDNVSLNAGDQQIFNAVGKDASGNQTSILHPVWTTSGGGMITPNGTQCTYSATTAGTYTITCEEQGTGTGPLRATTAIQGTAFITVVVTSVKDQIENLIARIEDLVAAGLLNQGNGNALTAKLGNALKSLEKGNERAAINKINAFINQVQAFIRSGKLPAVQGQILIDIANNIISDLT
jgi:hypothetical protein